MTATTVHKPRRRTRADWRQLGIERLKADVEPNRISLAIGCHLLGSFDAPMALDLVIGHLACWARDPEHLPALGWPQCSSPWTWDAGEDVAVWHDCRLVALVTKRPDGGADVRRLGR